MTRPPTAVTAVSACFLCRSGDDVASDFRSGRRMSTMRFPHLEVRPHGFRGPPLRPAPHVRLTGAVSRSSSRPGGLAAVLPGPPFGSRSRTSVQGCLVGRRAPTGPRARGATWSATAAARRARSPSPCRGVARPPGRWAGSLRPEGPWRGCRAARPVVGAGRGAGRAGRFRDGSRGGGTSVPAPPAERPVGACGT
jgi:hypothetical protein